MQPTAGLGWFPGSNLEPEQCGQGSYTGVSGGRPSVVEALRAHASVICLQRSLPPYSATEQVSLKKKVSTTVPYVSGQKPDTEETSKQKKQ